MDPRYLRSRERLRSAVYELASQRAVDDLTVSEVCRLAGVTRDTFYRHASSPLDLLAAALGDDVEGVAQGAADAIVEGADQGFFESSGAVLAHVAEHASVYRNAMRPQLLAPLRSNLERAFRAALGAYLQQHPQIAPSGVDRDDPHELGFLAAYAAAGTVGAIEQWLAADPLDVERGALLMVSAAPEFWLTSSDRTRLGRV